VGLPRRKVFEFSSKNAEFVHFYCEKKLYLWPETGTRGLIDPLGAENVKRTGVKNLAGRV